MQNIKNEGYYTQPVKPLRASLLSNSSYPASPLLCVPHLLSSSMIAVRRRGSSHKSVWLLRKNIRLVPAEYCVESPNLPYLMINTAENFGVARLDTCELARANPPLPLPYPEPSPALPLLLADGEDGEDEGIWSDPENMQKGRRNMSMTKAGIRA